VFGHMGGKETEGGSSGFRSLKGDWDISEKIVTARARHSFHRSVRSNTGIQRLAVWATDLLPKLYINEVRSRQMSQGSIVSQREAPEPATQRLERVYTDFWGPFNGLSLREVSKTER
jgi:hypothetical protein